MIDVAWMNAEKMKWIGWDKQGYYAWITPKGMIYLFKDLKRNEKGKEWEKEHGTMRLPDDGRTQSFWPTGRDFYEWEKEVQENCGFCNDSRATMESGKESESGDKGSEGLDIPAWKNLLDGGGVTDLRKVTNTDDVTYRGFATDTSKIGYETYGAPYANGNDVNPNEYIGNHDASEYIGPVPYAPPVPMPTSTPTYTPPPRKQNPVINTQKVADISKVLTPAQSPFQKIMEERKKAFEESVGKTINLRPDPIDNLRTNDALKNRGAITFPKALNGDQSPLQKKIQESRKAFEERLGTPNLNIPFERRKYRYIDQPEEDFDYHDPQEKNEKNRNDEKDSLRLVEFLSNVIDERAKRAWKLSYLPNNKVEEKGFLIVREIIQIESTGRINAEIKYSTANWESGTETNISWWDYNIGKNQELVGQVHTHPYKESKIESSAPSFQDINQIRNRNENYVSFVETGTKRYAIVIEDVQKAREFYSTNNLQTLQRKYLEYIKIALGSFEQKTEYAVMNLLRGSGIGFYISDFSKRTFTKQR